MKNGIGLFQYFQSRIIAIIISITAIILGFLVIALGSPGLLPGTSTYALLIVFCIIGLGFVIDFNLSARFLRKLSAKETDSDPAFRDPEKRYILQLMNKRDRECKKQLMALEEKQKEALDFFSAWIHELKTPSAAARIIASADPERNKALLHELDRLDNDLERALFYIRSSSFSEDFLISEILIKELVDASIRDFRTQFISSGIRFSQQGTDLSVKSDPVWLRFIFDQLIQNSLKYTPSGGSIEVIAEVRPQLIRLSVRDTGCGIPDSDRNRIFRRGFTGDNNRDVLSRGKSTGMGLFLARGLAGKLGHRLSLAESSRGTLFHLDFPFWSDFHNPVQSM